MPSSGDPKPLAGKTGTEQVPAALTHWQLCSGQAPWPVPDGHSSQSSAQHRQKSHNSSCAEEQNPETATNCDQSPSSVHPSPLPPSPAVLVGQTPAMGPASPAASLLGAGGASKLRTSRDQSAWPWGKTVPLILSMLHPRLDLTLTLPMVNFLWQSGGVTAPKIEMCSQLLHSVQEKYSIPCLESFLLLIIV